MSATLPEPAPPMVAFDIRGALPRGTTLLEASAGTGKTYTVAAIVTRLVAEGVARLPDLLVVTFGRAASQELRERVRQALTEAERALTQPDDADRSDAVIDLLLHLPDQAVVLERLRDALADFDAATIATTHQFCHLVLRSLGVAGDLDPGATLVESLDELTSQVIEDLYLARYAAVSTPPLSAPEAGELGRLVIADPHAWLATTDLDPATPAGARVEFAHAVRAEMDRRKRLTGVLGYDDLLSRLADALAQADAPARERMAQRWSFVLVDEFQDTDPVQWQVIERAFQGRATIVLIGDPKQAIYAFRGGDIFAYLAAAHGATTTATLAANHRADPALVRSLHVVLDGAELGDPRIRVRPVQPARHASRLVGAPAPAPWRVRLLPRESGSAPDELMPIEAVRARIAADVAADIARLLGSGATWDGQPIAARHVAVLVHDRGPGALIEAELAAYGIHAVLAGGVDILQTRAARDWVGLLTALEQPERPGVVRAAALTSLVGAGAEDLDAGGDRYTDELAHLLRGWAALGRGPGGVAAILEAAEQRGLPQRLLRQVGGERLLTDLRHVAQAVHEAAVRDGLGPAARLAWLHRARERPGGMERTRRLDSDAAAVQIVTIHASKGLQYPVVYLPFEFESYQRTEKVGVRFHDELGRRCIDVTAAGASWSAHQRLGRAEDLGERLRQAYVALTRAQSQVVCWWAASHNTATSGLHRLLFGRAPGGAQVPDQVRPPTDAEATRILTLWQQHGGPTLEWADGQPATVVPAPPSPTPLQVRRLGRSIDVQWQRTSYSALIRAEDSQPPGVGSEPDRAGIADEPDSVEDHSADRPLARQPAIGRLAGDSVLPSPMAALPAGAGFGSLVHAVLEHADPQADDLHAELLTQVEEQMRWWPVEAGADQIASALLPMFDTPLGPLASGATLRGIPMRDRLRELDFEIPLAGGDRADPGSGEPRLSDLAQVLERHLPASDPLRPYAARLRSPSLGHQPLRGYLSGSIDVLLRLPGDDGPAAGSPDRFLVVDYKTNLLGQPDRELTSADYHTDRLTEAMVHSHYPLQTLLYSVVAQRFLRWRVPGYDPQRQWGGVLYLFVRGMCGPDTPVHRGHPAGVFAWRPSVELIDEVGGLLAAGRPR